jgi:tetratricopeptide (TPR) repeat protein
MCLRIAITVTVSLLTLMGQEANIGEVRGAIAGQEITLHGYVAELNDVIHPGAPVHTDVASDGTFVLRGVPYGDYVLRITNYYGTPITEQFVTVHEKQMPVEVRLPNSNVPRPGAGRVSVRQLQHPPTTKAVDAALTGERFAESGQYARAAEELRKAVRISPEYAQAHSRLAVQYIRLHEYEEAIVEIERAIEITGAEPAELCNLAFARTALGQYDEATATAREALRIDPKHAAAHYILGTLLLRRNETRAEGIAHLERAASTMEGARAALARLKSVAP